MFISKIKVTNSTKCSSKPNLLRNRVWPKLWLQPVFSEEEGRLEHADYHMQL